MKPCPSCGWMLQPNDAACNMCGSAAGGGGAPAGGGGGGYPPPPGAPPPAAGGGPAGPSYLRAGAYAPAGPGMPGAPQGMPGAPQGMPGPAMAPPPAAAGPAPFTGGAEAGPIPLSPWASMAPAVAPAAPPAAPSFASGGFGAPPPAPSAPPAPSYGGAAAGGYGPPPVMNAPMGAPPIVQAPMMAQQGMPQGMPSPGFGAGQGMGGMAPPPYIPSSAGNGAPPPPPLVGLGGVPAPPPLVPPPPPVVGAAPAMPGGYGAPPAMAPPPAVAPAPAAMRSPGALSGALQPSEGASGGGVLVGFLVTFQNEPNGTHWTIRSGRMQLGRSGADARVDVAINDASASSRHASIVADPTTGQAFIEDDGSRNGTFVNEQRVQQGEQRQLHDNDRLRIGSTTFVIKLLVS